jgi:hypothetical protein
MEHFGTQLSTLEMHSSLERPEFLAGQFGIDVPDYTTGRSVHVVSITSTPRTQPGTWKHDMSTILLHAGHHAESASEILEIGNSFLQVAQ